MSPEFLLVFVPAVFLLIGAIVIWFGRRNRQLALASARWPQVGGTVTGVSVSRRRRTKGGTRYAPVISYAYEVGGRAHSGSRLGFASSERTTEEAAWQLLAPYQVGSAVTVFYDPADPSVSTLSTSASGTMVAEILGWILVIVGLGFFAFRFLM